MSDPFQKNGTDYEDYQSTSSAYDDTRSPLGIDVILGCLAASPFPLAEQRVLDAGCGTGNFVMAIKDKVAQVVGLEINSGMFARANQKLSGVENVQLRQGSIIEPSFEAETFNGVMCNQVIHHLLAEDETGAFPQLRAMMQEMFRVLRPGGVVIFNTSSQRQLRDGYWWADLIPEAMEIVARRYPPVPDMEAMLQETGFSPAGVIVPLHEVLQAEAYLDPEGPLKQGYRDGDSTWALATEGQLERALERVRRMNREGEMQRYLQDREALRKEIGQTTFVFARKPN
jgi:ubiquinone/menaquinone biosynthesis C-methylase UbiE